MRDPFADTVRTMIVHIRQGDMIKLELPESAAVKLIEAYVTRDPSARSNTVAVETRAGIYCLELNDVIGYGVVLSPDAKRDLAKHLL